MPWILIMSLFSNTSGNYIREFSSEKQCVTEMNKVIRKTDSTNIKYIGCVVNAVAIANNESEE